MEHKERFFRTVAREKIDRPASWLGLPTPDAVPGLLEHFGVADIDALRNEIDDDVYPVEMPYRSPTSDAIYMAFDFAHRGRAADDERSLTAPGFFMDISDPARVDDFDWPDPANYIDRRACRAVVDSAPADRAILGVVWSAHFQDACAAFGMETALVKMMTEPEMVDAVFKRIVDFYLKANEIFYESTRGRLDAVLIGNDFGSQTGLMLSRDLIRRYVWPGTRQLIEQAHAYGLKVVHHSCGAVADLIDDLIELGADVIHPIQALARGMDPASLRRDYGQRVAFCGGVDAQELLVRGKPEEVADKVRQLKAIFPTGLVISPSHEAILPDIDPSRIEALFRAVRE